jgi:PIN domain nuclease of toxin-antitoxin system
MNYLIDTHVFLWSIFDSKKLSPVAYEEMMSMNNNVYVSLITFWEISLKFNLGKLDLVNVLPDDLPSLTLEAGFEILGLKPDDVASFYQLPKYSHKDPFDRLIIWQSIQNKMTLISNDSKFGEYKNLGLKILW